MHFPWQAQYKRHVHFRRSGHSFISFAGLGLGFWPAGRPASWLPRCLVGLVFGPPAACLLLDWLAVCLPAFAWLQPARWLASSGLGLWPAGRPAGAWFVAAGPAGWLDGCEIPGRTTRVCRHGNKVILL